MEISRGLYIFLKNGDKRSVEPKFGTAAIRSQSLLSAYYARRLVATLTSLLACT